MYTQFIPSFKGLYRPLDQIAHCPVPSVEEKCNMNYKVHTKLGYFDFHQKLKAEFIIHQHLDQKNHTKLKAIIH
jgi:hypothetical protein